MQVQTAGVTLPVSPTQVDGSCFNQQLPQGNDAWPQVQFPQGADTNIGSYAIALFRSYAQSRAQKSNIHCFCYNLLQQNRFQNQFWQGWCQYVVDFADFLHRGQQNQPNAAADKAAARIYQAMLATVAQQYPAVKQLVANAGDAATLNGLNDAASVANNIQNDINQWKARLQGGVGMGGGGIGVGVGVGVGGGVSHTQHVNAFAVSGVGQPTSSGYNNPTGPATVGSSGLLLGSDNVAPAKPTSSWQGGGTVNSNIQQPSAQGLAPQPGAAATPIQKAAASDVIDHIHNAPISTDDVKVDPKFYIPQGFKPVDGRPYDVIRNPGGVEIRPAYQALKGADKASWKRTVGSDKPYAAVVNPNTHIVFLAKWVDGIVKEVIVQIEPEMDYLKHEINEELRRKAMRPIGISVPLPKYALSEDTSVKTIEVTRQALADGLVKPELLSPVALDGYITGTTDLENETMARNAVISQLDLPADAPVPPHEYITVCMHELQISEECFNDLFAFEKYTTPTEVVAGLKVLVESGKLPLRYYTFINERLTRAVNDFLADSLALEKVRITDYFADAVELGPYLAAKRGDEYQQVYLGNTQSIVARCMSVASEETPPDVEGGEPIKTYGIVDEYLNFQLGLPSEELSTLNLTNEACLVSPASHPNMVNALHAMIARAKELDNARRMRMRLITSDGFYYIVVVGKLIKNALLLKRV
ncbi:hypothetical protein FDI21_gp126 [Pseudomonas phage Noxifer]|uniref:Uncharacterized protein n=1 Tax=Pseudomonas phage Noxifer TaxID=2006684 RepID=A0A1Y0SXN1_9CAUD|nr:hypothetical protein FDI21_gp126 [Pseudomonas phage Noxifer]ARV77295.1 hypothetical protein NOXIFER_126 [Pseudomonas phage Noxifer]